MALAHYSAAWLVKADAEGFPVIPGRYGRIEWHDETALAVYCPRPRMFAPLWAIPNLSRHQVGSTEARGLFPPEALEQVAGVIHARRRWPRPSLRQMEGLRPRHRATSGGRDAS